MFLEGIAASDEAGEDLLSAVHVGALELVDVAADIDVLFELFEAALILELVTRVEAILQNNLEVCQRPFLLALLWGVLLLALCWLLLGERQGRLAGYA